MSNTEITIIVKKITSKEEWECDGCHQMTTAKPIDDEGGQYCFCSWQCLMRWEHARGY